MNGIVNERAASNNPIVMDPSNSQRLYWGTFRLYQTNNGAGSWSAISPDLTTGTGGVSAIAVAPSSPDTVYVGTSDAQVQVTVDALGPTPTWENRSAGLPNRWVTKSAVDNCDAANAYATFSGFNGQDHLGHVYATNDYGRHWTDVSGNLPNIPVNDVAIDPDQENVLYLATDVGVFASDDGGKISPPRRWPSEHSSCWD
jgi:hypothetical protein